MLRVEDTDAGRNLPESYQGLYDSLTWLGLTWDEGPGVGGPYAPYIQSERGEIYADVVARLLDGGHAYRCYCTREEIEAREAARPAGAPSGYDGFCRDLSPERVAELDRLGTPSVVRMRVPDGEIRLRRSGARADRLLRRRTFPTTSSSAAAGTRSTPWSTRWTTR